MTRTVQFGMPPYEGFISILEWHETERLFEEERRRDTTSR